MNELIKISEKRTVSARGLHDYLGATERFSTWIERQFQYGFIEGTDYIGCKVFNALAKQELEDYSLTIDCAKEISMLQKTEKGKEARMYFIAFEKHYRAEVVTHEFNLPKTHSEALRQLAESIEEKEKLQLLIETQKPAVEFYEAVTDSKDAISMGEAAKVLNMGIGRNDLFKFLRDRKILMPNNSPYQEFIDRGYFRVIEQKFDKPDGSIAINIKTIVYQRGLDFIRKQLQK